jgi:hypothetical protein
MPGSAQGTPSIARLEVAIWPEYDKPSVLVIYRLQLASGTVLPADVTVPIPASVGEPLAVAKQASDGTLVNTTYTRQVQGDWATITLQTDSLNAQLEYYAPLTVAGQGRHFTYTWPGGVTLGALAYSVQQPVGAADMQVTPTPAEARPGADGLMYYLAELGPQDVSASRTIDVTYSRSTSQLSVEALQPTPVISPATQTQGRALDLTRLLPRLIGGLGVLLIGLGTFLYFRMGRVAPAARPRRHAPPADRAGGIDASAIFCHNCGMQASVSDLYCRRCGTRLRN